MTEADVALVQVEFAKPHWPSMHAPDSGSWAVYDGAQHHADYLEKLQAKRPERAHRISDYMAHAEQVGTVLIHALQRQDGFEASQPYYLAMDATLTDHRELARGIVGDIEKGLGRLWDSIAQEDGRERKKRAVFNMSAGIFDFQSPSRELTHESFEGTLRQLFRLVTDDMLFVRAAGNYMHNPEVETGQEGVMSAGLGNVITIGVGDEQEGIYPESAVGDFAVDCYVRPANGWHATSFAAPRMAGFARALMKAFPDVPSHFIKSAIIRSARRPDVDYGEQLNANGFKDEDETVLMMPEKCLAWGSRGGAGYVAIPDDPAQYPATATWQLLESWRNYSLPSIDQQALESPTRFACEGGQCSAFVTQSLSPFNTMLAFHVRSLTGERLDGHTLGITLISPEINGQSTRIQLKRPGTDFDRGSLCSSAFIGENTAGLWQLEVTGMPPHATVEADIRFSGVPYREDPTWQRTHEMASHMSERVMEHSA
ncbi:S8 family serine peptidase [bacterium]|nr:S8 family serine peptidase [bacterium]